MKWKLTRLSGIDVFVHWSFWLLPAVLLLAYGPGMVLFIFALFGCVVLHEMGHALAARYYGIGTRDITLYPIGGVASLERIPTRPSQELVIALAGPAVNVVIALALFVVLGAGPLLTLGSAGLIGGGFFSSLMLMNVMLVVFNMLPAFPMDGGRVLRALLAMFLPYASATEIAGRIGQGMAIVLGVLGIFSSFNLVLVAVFVFLAASAEVARVSQYRPVHPTFYDQPPGTSAFGADVEDDDGIFWVDRAPRLVRDPKSGNVYFIRSTWPG